MKRHKAALATSASLVSGASLVIVCSYFEKTCKLPDDGRGLSIHYGIWAIFVGSPLLVIISSVAYFKFVRTIQDLGHYTIGSTMPSDLKKIVDKTLASLRLQTWTRYLFYLILLVAWTCWLKNVIQTIHPYDSYGNDVFDSYAHPWGFYSFKLYLAFLWVAVYPVMTYAALHIFASMIYILRYMGKNKLFRLDFFHEDECGGVSVFGEINLLLLSMTFIVLATVIAIKLTHLGNYPTIWGSIIVSFLLLLVQSIAGVYHIHLFVRSKKREVLGAVNVFLNQALMKAGQSKKFPGDLLALRNHVAAIRSFPYARGVRLFVNILRLSPAALGLFHVIQRLWVASKL